VTAAFPHALELAARDAERSGITAAIATAP
jgi:hypothetical protein